MGDLDPKKKNASKLKEHKLLRSLDRVVPDGAAVPEDGGGADTSCVKVDMFEEGLILSSSPASTMIAGVTQLLPESVSPWITLLTSISNVVIVVTNVKLNIGERIADASMANKGFGSLASLLEFALCDMVVDPNSVDIKILLAQIK